MIAEDLADLIQAHRASPALWIARCPAHDDRGQSLFISNGRDGAVQFRCSAGCSYYKIMDALGFGYSAINSRPSPPPDFAQMTAPQRADYRREKHERQLAHAAACDRVRKLQQIADKLGTRLNGLPISEERTKLLVLWLTAESKLRHAEKEEERLRA